MKRRTFTLSVTALGTTVLAGCIGDGGTSSENGGDDESETDTPAKTDTPAATETPVEQTETQTPAEETDSDAEETTGEDPAAVVEAFFQTLSTADVDQINGFLHPETDLEPVGDDEATQLAGLEFTIDGIEVTEQDETSALVDVQFSEDSNQVMRRFAGIELRPSDGGWKIHDFEGAEQPPEQQPPRAAFEFDTDGTSVTVTHTSGESVPDSELFVRGDQLEQTGSWRSLGGETDDGMVTAGLSLTVQATDSPVSVDIVWESTEGADAAMLASATLEVATVPQAVEEYLADATGYDGVVDWTDRADPTIVVAADDQYIFDPPAVRISPGTTVVWEWSGDRGSHNVVNESDVFESDLVAREGYTFEHTFEEPGTFLYYCFPHKRSGMKGAIVVE